MQQNQQPYITANDIKVQYKQKDKVLCEKIKK